MIRLIAFAAFAIVVTTSVEAMPLAPVAPAGVRYWTKADIGPRAGALVTCARIWREIFKLIRLAFPFF